MIQSPVTPDPALSAPAEDSDRVTRRGPLAVALALLALMIGAASLLGPTGSGLLTYRTSPTTLNQLRGSDAAALFFVVPLTLVAAVLAAQRHRVAPLLATGIGAYALYTYFQVVVGQEYLRLPGNVERFFPLYLGLFVVAEAVVVCGLRAAPALPRPPRVLERVAGIGLLVVAAFLVLGLHLRSMIFAWQDPAALSEYASSPTPFWMVKLMDLGIVVPAAVLTGVGLLRGAVWARRAMYILFTGYTCLAVSVAAMGLVMVVNRDPDASLGLTAGFSAFAVVFGAITVLLYRPLLGSGAGLRSAAGQPLRHDRAGSEGQPERWVRRSEDGPGLALLRRPSTLAVIAVVFLVSAVGQALLQGYAGVNSWVGPVVFSVLGSSALALAAYRNRRN